MKDIISASANVATNGEPVAGLMSTIIGKGMKYYDNKRNERFKSFYKELYEGTAIDKRIEYEKQIHANEEDYYNLLNAAVNDEELEKVKLYTNTFNYIKEHQDLDKRLKLRYLKILKTLSFYTLNLLPKIYIYKIYSIQGNIDDKTFIMSQRRKNTYEVEQLFQLGLFERENETRDNSIKATTIFYTAIKMFFKPEEITPQFQGIKVWDRKVIVFMDLNDVKGFMRVSKILESKGVKVQSNGNILSVKQENFLTNINTIICVLNNEIISEESINLLKKYSKQYKIIKVCLEENINDQLHELTGELIYLKENSQDHINAFFKKLELDPTSVFF